MRGWPKFWQDAHMGDSGDAPPPDVDGRRRTQDAVDGLVTILLASPLGLIPAAIAPHSWVDALLITVAYAALLLWLLTHPPMLVRSIARVIQTRRAVGLLIAAIAALLPAASYLSGLAVDQSVADPVRKPQLEIDGSIGVANATTGDTEYQASVQAAPGDLIAVSIYARNRQMTGAITGLRVKYAVHNLTKDRVLLRIRYFGGRVDPVHDIAEVASPDGTAISLAPVDDGAVKYRGTDPHGRWINQYLTYVKMTDSIHLPLIASAMGQDEFTLSLYFDVVKGPKTRATG
jgi:hypothetical protein